MKSSGHLSVQRISPESVGSSARKQTAKRAGRDFPFVRSANLFDEEKLAPATNDLFILIRSGAFHQQTWLRRGHYIVNINN